MRFSLVNPPWNFDKGIYFGCREPHLPLEYGYAKALLENAGHEAQVVDGQLDDLTNGEIRDFVKAFKPDFTVITTAPSYLFWRCAPPELRVPQATARELRDVCGTLVVVGPHASTTPSTTLRKLAADIAVMGECEEILPQLTRNLESVPSISYTDGDEVRVQGQPHACNLKALPALRWERETIARHRHHHHRFDLPPQGPGAEMETSRGCPYHCTFCAKDNFRDTFRRRDVETVAAELDGLLSHGVEYVYFIDEIFLPHVPTLEAIAERGIKIGVQTRIDLWNEPMIDLLAKAGCVSIEAGVESITEAGRDVLNKRCKLSTEEIADRLIYAKELVPFVQANLLDSQDDDPEDVERWRKQLLNHGIWANKPVPLFPYPGSPEYTRRWGRPDDLAWERAHAAYLGRFHEFSDIQESQPAPLEDLELVTIKTSEGHECKQ